MGNGPSEVETDGTSAASSLRAACVSVTARSQPTDNVQIMRSWTDVTHVEVQFAPDFSRISLSF
jgi:hypothetical protein